MPRAAAEVRIAKALSHPLRRRLLAVYSARVASPKEIADELGAPLGDVSYHTRQLLDAGWIELVRTERRRGAVVHFYGTSRMMLDDQQWRDLPVRVRGRVAGEVLDAIWQDVVAAFDAGAFRDDDLHLSRTTLELDVEGWAELGALLRGTVESALRIQAASARRRAADGPPSRAITSELAVLHFARPPAAEDAASADA